MEKKSKDSDTYRVRIFNLFVFRNLLIHCVVLCCLFFFFCYFIIILYLIIKTTQQQQHNKKIEYKELLEWSIAGGRQELRQPQRLHHTVHSNSTAQAEESKELQSLVNLLLRNMPFNFKVGGVGGALTMSLDAIADANKKAKARAAKAQATKAKAKKAKAAPKKKAASKTKKAPASKKKATGERQRKKQLQRQNQK